MVALDTLLTKCSIGSVLSVFLLIYMCKCNKDHDPTLFLLYFTDIILFQSLSPTKTTPHLLITFNSGPPAFTFAELPIGDRTIIKKGSE